MARDMHNFADFSMVQPFHPLYRGQIGFQDPFVPSLLRPGMGPPQTLHQPIPRTEESGFNPRATNFAQPSHHRARSAGPGLYPGYINYGVVSDDLRSKAHLPLKESPHITLPSETHDHNLYRAHSDYGINMLASETRGNTQTRTNSLLSRSLSFSETNSKEWTFPEAKSRLPVFHQLVHEDASAPTSTKPALDSNHDLQPIEQPTPNLLESYAKPSGSPFHSLNHYSEPFGFSFGSWDIQGENLVSQTANADKESNTVDQESSLPSRGTSPTCSDDSNQFDASRPETSATSSRRNSISGSRLEADINPQIQPQDQTTGRRVNGERTDSNSSDLDFETLANKLLPAHLKTLAIDCRRSSGSSNASRKSVDASI